MKKILLTCSLLILITSCENNLNDDTSSVASENSVNSKSKRMGTGVNSILYGTNDSNTGEFINIENDTSTLDPILFPYIDNKNVAFYDNSFLLTNCLQNGKECVDLAHFIGRYVLAVNHLRIPVFYGEFSDFDNISASEIMERKVIENGSQNILVTHTWMSNNAANTVLDKFRADIHNSGINVVKAINIYTKEYFGPSRQVIVKVKY